MITMDREDTQNSSELLTPSEAVAYLKGRGVEIKVTALRARRLRGRANASRVLGRTSLWTKAELDKIKPRVNKNQPNNS